MGGWRTTTSWTTKGKRSLCLGRASGGAFLPTPRVWCDESDSSGGADSFGPSLAHMGNPRMKTSIPARFASDCARLHLPHTPDFAAPTQATFAVETTPKNDTVCGTFWELVYTRASDKVMVYGGPAVGWQRGVVQGVAEGTSWCPTGSAESAFHLVSRATERDEEAVDFGFVPDSRVFTVNMSGVIERGPCASVVQHWR